jgi:hypothetical protein
MLIGLQVNNMLKYGPFTGLYRSSDQFFRKTINQINQAFVLVL